MNFCYVRYACHAFVSDNIVSIVIPVQIPKIYLDLFLKIPDYKRNDLLFLMVYDTSIYNMIQKQILSKEVWSLN